jgi:hypothetical protein
VEEAFEWRAGELGEGVGATNGGAEDAGRHMSDEHELCEDVEVEVRTRERERE